MRIRTITDKFSKRQSCRGAYMVSEYDSDTETQRLTYRGTGKLIAEIYDHKNSQNYRLRLHPRPDYTGKTAHINRVASVLWSMQMGGSDTPNNWDLFRYSGRIHYTLKVYDRALQAEYTLESKPMEFIYRNGALTLDYQHFEGLAFPDKPKPVELDENSNLQSINEQLNAIVAGV